MWSEIARPDPAVVGWRAAAAAMATDLYATLARHPWLAQAFGSQLPARPGQGLVTMITAWPSTQAAGLDTGAQADQAAVTVLTFVLGYALGAAAEASLTRKLGQNGGDGAALLRDRMAEAREIAARFPRLRVVSTRPRPGTARRPRTASSSAARAILDGLQAKLASRP